MKEIVKKLQEGREVKLAKSILESSGYKVAKRKNSRMNEDYDDDEDFSWERFQEELYPEVLRVMKSCTNPENLIEDILDMLDEKYPEDSYRGDVIVALFWKWYDTWRKLGIQR